MVDEIMLYIIWQKLCFEI